MIGVLGTQLITGAHRWINHCLNLMHGLARCEQYIFTGHGMLVARQFRFSISFSPVENEHATSIYTTASSFYCYMRS